MIQESWLGLSVAMMISFLVGLKLVVSHKKIAKEMVQSENAVLQFLHLKIGHPKFYDTFAEFFILVLGTFFTLFPLAILFSKVF